ncbi:MAG: exodeoxyribonuclease VII large subunit [Gammaproteobacteria bacterium]|nr:exodeoxyribonuclease VII large subunit [Gammaproteobacteria bacterium]
MAAQDGPLDLFRHAVGGEQSGSAAGAPVEAPARASGERGGAAEPWTVAQVNRRARFLLEQGMSALWVAGEVGNWRRVAAGHRYFTLKDETAHIGAVMFASDARRLPADPEDGTRVRAFGSVTLYEARGRYQLRVRRLTAEDGEGLWRRAFEQVRRKLQAEGLMDPARRRALPACPACVGVVTSATGAALHDILSVIRARAPWTRVLLRSARVQGEGAAEDVARAIDEIGRSGQADVVLVGRGGGSLEDLWAFNREEVARAIAACPVPVVSAVGHEVDVTIADLVADLRAPTPSAGAEAVVPDRAVLARRLADLGPRLSTGLRRSVHRYRDRLEYRAGRLRRGIDGVIEPRTAQVFGRSQRLAAAMRAHLAVRRARLENASGRLDALSPLATLSRGYAVPLDRSGRVLRNVAGFPRGSSFDLRVVDGRVGCRVTGTRPDERAVGGTGRREVTDPERL